VDNCFDESQTQHQKTSRIISSTQTDITYLSGNTVQTNRATSGICLSMSTSALAFPWLWFGRGAASTGARAGAAASVTEGAAARSVGQISNASRQAAAIGRASSAANRYCIRSINDRRYCDWHTAERTHDAVSRAVGSNYKVLPTSQVGVFEIIDAVGTVIDIVEAISEASDPSVTGTPQYQGLIDSNSPVTARSAQEKTTNYEAPSATINKWEIQARQVPLLISANGPILVWVENGPKKEVQIGEQIRFLRPGLIHVQGLNAEATELFQVIEATSGYNTTPLNAPVIPPADGRIRYRSGDPNPCPYAGTVPIAWVNGSVRCGPSR
jgi:hypothetical protein